MQDWEDLIYEKRNKSYGSYLLRKKQVKYIIIGLLTSIILFCTPVLVFYYKFQNHSDDMEMPMSIPMELSNPSEFEKLIEPPPPPIEKTDNKITEAIPVVTDSVPEVLKKDTEDKEKVKAADTLPIAEKEKAEDGNGSDAEGDNRISVTADQMPQFIGGTEGYVRFMHQNLVYPVNAAKQKIQGQVIVQFVVTQTGEIKNIKLIAGVSPELDKEALRIISILPKWIPGKRAGKAVSLQIKIPIVFKL